MGYLLQVAAQAEELARHRDGLTESEEHLALLDSQVRCAAQLPSNRT